MYQPEYLLTGGRLRKTWKLREYSRKVKLNCMKVPFISSIRWQILAALKYHLVLLGLFGKNNCSLSQPVNYNLIFLVYKLAKARKNLVR